MASLKILNVGQGDSFILLPSSKCKFHECDIFIDLGDGHHDIFTQCHHEKAIVLLSHSHADHIGGISYSIHRCFQRIHEIWLPYYFDEICAITDFILRLKGKNRLSGDNGAVIKAKNILSMSKLMQYLRDTTAKPVRGLYDGLKMCNHLEIFNPPLAYNEALDIDVREFREYIEGLQKTKYQEIKKWFYEEDRDTIYRTILTEGWGYNVPRLIYDDTLTFDNRLNFVLGMIFKLRNDIDRFAVRPNGYNFARIMNKVTLSSNDASVVLKFSDPMLGTMLFTGDVGVRPLRRLISNNADLAAQTLKVPHHGSRHNLNKQILKYINPSLAIISHGNGRFGRQSDPHPNKHIIKLLDDHNIPTIYTNDVIKDGQVVKKKPKKSSINSYVEYIDYI